MSERRESERHGLKIPLNIELDNLVFSKTEYLNDISTTGLCFKAAVEVKKGSLINIKIPILKPVFEIKGKVVWCKRTSDYYDVGVEFLEVKDLFKVKMIKQVCYIENYKRKIFEKEGRILTGEDAALEWISKFAENFDGK